MTLSLYFLPLDTKTYPFREASNSFHLIEADETPYEYSKLVWLEGLIESRGAKRGIDYVIELRQNFIGDGKDAIAIHCAGSFFSTADDYLERGPYQTRRPTI